MEEFSSQNSKTTVLKGSRMPPANRKNNEKKVMAISPKQVMDLRVAKGFSEAQSNEHKRNWNDKKMGPGIGVRNV